MVKGLTNKLGASLIVAGAIAMGTLGYTSTARAENYKPTPIEQNKYNCSRQGDVVLDLNTGKLKEDLGGWASGLRDLGQGQDYATVALGLKKDDPKRFEVLQGLVGKLDKNGLPELDFEKARALDKEPGMRTDGYLVLSNLRQGYFHGKDRFDTELGKYLVANGFTKEAVSDFFTGFNAGAESLGVKESDGGGKDSGVAKAADTNAPDSGGTTSGL